MHLGIFVRTLAEHPEVHVFPISARRPVEPRALRRRVRHRRRRTRGRGACFPARLPILLSEAPTPERCVEGYYIHRTRFELIAERKVRRRQLTDDGNVEITGRDLREREFRAAVHPSTYRSGDTL